MHQPLLRGAADAYQQGDPRDLFGADMISPLSDAIVDNLGNSSAMSHPKYTGPTHYGKWKFPVIPYGVPTTMIPVPFPLTRAPIKPTVMVQEQVQLVIVFVAALVIWMLPTTCINKRLGCRWLRTCLSKWLGLYFFLGFVLNLTAISLVIAKSPHIDANSLFFTAVALLEKVIDQIQKVLIQFAALAALILLWVFRKKIGTILGLDQQIIKASLRDILTGFSMKRFKAVEVSLWKAEGLPVSFSSKTLFTRITLGFNEAQHTRPIDNLRENYPIKERTQLNYDPEDDTQKMSIMIKMQEVIGASVNQLLPAAGAMVGAVGGLTTPLGPATGAALGVVTGTGAANSVGAEVARVDLSSAMINRIMKRFESGSAANTERLSARTAGVRWSESEFQRVDLIPQGYLWLRIVDIE